MTKSLSGTSTDIHDEPSWLEKVWMEVQAEIDYESKHPQPSCYDPDEYRAPDYYDWIGL